MNKIQMCPAQMFVVVVVTKYHFSAKQTDPSCDLVSLLLRLVNLSQLLHVPVVAQCLLYVCECVCDNKQAFRICGSCKDDAQASEMENAWREVNDRRKNLLYLYIRTAAASSKGGDGNIDSNNIMNDDLRHLIIAPMIILVKKSEDL